MTESNEYLKIEILLTDNHTVHHYERLTTDEKITFNNFMAKFDRNDNGFIPINNNGSTFALSTSKIIMMQPMTIEKIES